MANPGQPPLCPAQEPGTASPPDLPEMQTLLAKVGDQDDVPLKAAKSLSGALDLEHNGHGLPFKVMSEGPREASLPRSSSRASSRRASSIATTSYAQDRDVPKDYLVLAIASCFCPVWPLNLIPLIFSIMVSVALCGRAGAGPGLGRQAPLAGTGHPAPGCRGKSGVSPGWGWGSGKTPLLRGPFTPPGDHWGQESFCLRSPFIAAPAHPSLTWHTSLLGREPQTAARS